MNPTIGLAGVLSLCRQRSRVRAAVSWDCDMNSFICVGISFLCEDPSSENAFLMKFSTGVDILSFLLCSFIFTKDSCAITNRSWVFALFEAWFISVAMSLLRGSLSVNVVVFIEVGFADRSSIFAWRAFTVSSRALLNSC